MVRLHAVLVPPPHALADLFAAVEQANRVVADKSRRGAPSLPWLPRNEWHVRLAYFGNLGLKESNIVRQTLTEISALCAPLHLRILGAEAVPDEQQADAIEVGVAGDTDDLWTLARAIPAMVQPLGLYLDRRSFHPAIVVARGSRGPFDARLACSRLSAFEGVPWSASEMRVVRWVPGTASSADTWETVETYRFTAPREEPEVVGDTEAAR